MILLAAAIVSGCLAVAGDRIRAGELARSVPELASLPADTPLGYAPVPGARRILNARDLERLAAQHGITLAALPILCVERALEPLTEERVLAALQKALSGSQARFELVSFSHIAAPPGELEFARSGFQAPVAGSNAPALWRGQFRYDGNRSLLVWARVRVTVAGQRLVAAGILEANRPIQPAQVRVETAGLAPFGQPGLESFDQIAGRVPRRPIHAGEPLSANLLVAPLAVSRGETVKVQVSSGGAQLILPAQAESAGRPGETILLLNPASGRRFRARVEGPGKVKVDAQDDSGRSGAVSADAGLAGR
jgi:flagella basal body P-ring formation protein FlgA